jgi:hypothetical protein
MNQIIPAYRHFKSKLLYQKKLFFGNCVIYQQDLYKQNIIIRFYGID